MAVNDGLANSKPKHNEQFVADVDAKSGFTTTILPEGAVESRGTGTRDDSHLAISQQIRDVADNGELSHVQISLDGGLASNEKKNRIKVCGRSRLKSTLSDPEQTFTQLYDSIRLFVDSLAKPVGSLGSLEDWGARIAALQRTDTPTADNIVCLIFAADHGVAKDRSNGGMNCSAYPQEVSRKVLEGLDNNVAGASVLSKLHGVPLRVIDIGLVDSPGKNEWPGNIVRSSANKVIGGTNNFCRGNAMSEEEVRSCILAGREEAGKLIGKHKANLIIFGEVGIGNTTASSALVVALTGTNVQTVCGSGASTTRDGINYEIVERKIAIIKEAIDFHGASSMVGKPLKALKSMGGAEIASIVGGMLEASERCVPILVDGFIVTVAAMIACKLEPCVSRALLFASQSTEKGQLAALKTICDIASANGLPEPSKPALNMNLRMGEATGALSAISLVKSACGIVSELATLNEILEFGK